MENNSKLKILLVDDEEFIVSALSLKLEKRGMETVWAQNGMEGLQMARTEKPDAIILDIMLPGIDGFKVCKLLKSDDNTMHIPVIIASAKDGEDDLKVGLEVGADHYLTKPFKMGDILKLITELTTTV